MMYKKIFSRHARLNGDPLAYASAIGPYNTTAVGDATYDAAGGTVDYLWTLAAHRF